MIRCMAYTCLRARQEACDQLMSQAENPAAKAIDDASNVPVGRVGTGYESTTSTGRTDKDRSHERGRMPLKCVICQLERDKLVTSCEESDRKEGHIAAR